MSISAKVIADSIADGVRLTTLELHYPRIIHDQFMTHRSFSRNCASSRAIPVERRIADIEADPFIPLAFTKNQKGMQAGEVLDEEANEVAASCWRFAMLKAIQEARNLASVGVHKQHANRLLDAFSWMTTVCTATEFENWDGLRQDSHAQPEIQELARAMAKARAESEPRTVSPGDWHLPYVYPEDAEFCFGDLARGVRRDVKLSCARCARVSYLTQDGKRDPQADLDLYERLASAGHMSPLEHAAQVAQETDGFDLGKTYWTTGQAWHGEFCGNFRLPWVQHRKMIPGEDVFRGGQAG